MRYRHSSYRPKRAEPKPEYRCCGWDGCTEHADYRAPKSRNELNSYDYYCLAHIRQFNKSWNYYEGMEEEDVEADVRRDVHWRRPSWNFGTIGGKKGGTSFHGQRVHDPFGMFDEAENEAAGDGSALGTNTPEEAGAMKTLGLTPPVNVEDVKARYKVLVKCHHPDANNGAKESEEKFKEIAAAYRDLRDWINRGAAKTTKAGNGKRK